MSEYRPAIVTVSLGRAWEHDFDNKLKQAAKYGFQGIEVFYEDIEYLAKKIGNTTESPTTEQIVQATEHVKKLSDSLNLTIVDLQPFLFYDGLLDRTEHDRMIEKMKLWFRLAKILKTDTIQIPANFLPAEKLSGDFDVIASDLQEVADLGAKENPPIKFAYENLCWSTHVDTWEKVNDVVKRVDRPNFGLCLDTFNIAGRVWADPASPTGKNPNADSDLAESLKRMAKEVDVNKVFVIQVVDAERLEKPLVKGHEFHVEGQPPRMNWSRNARLFFGEEDRGAYLPVEDVAKVICKELGYKGWVSMELFSRTLAEKGEKVPEEHAKRGAESWRVFKERLGIK